MSSLEGNKIAAAILVGGMITLSVGILTDFIYRPQHGAQSLHFVTRVGSGFVRSLREYQGISRKNAK